MAEKGGQEGNQNAVKSKRLFTSALKRALTQGPERLEKIVEKLLTSAESGEPWAMKELMDRVDGKAPQPLTGGDDDDNPIGIRVVTRTIVKPNAPPADG